MTETLTTNPTDLSEEKLAAVFREMTLVRRIEERVGMAYQMQKFSGFCHLYIGQEAVASAVAAALQPEDYMLTAYREHGQAIAKGVDPYAVVAELFGKSTGSTGGRGGSMHIFDAEKGFLGGWGIVGGQIPLAAGVGFTIKYKEEKKVCVCFFGEGSIHQGVFHEALNMASLWDLPVVFLCENNKYAMGTRMDRISPIDDIQIKAKSYGMDHARVEGQDFFTCYQGIKEAVDRARNESRPTFLDVRTYRFRGHSMSDPGKYRSKAELEEEKSKDPILKLRKSLIGMGIMTDEQCDAVDKECKNIAKDCIARAEKGEFPDISTLKDYVYV